jgi:hypothetical protein
METSSSSALLFPVHSNDSKGLGVIFGETLSQLSDPSPVGVIDTAHTMLLVEDEGSPFGTTREGEGRGELGRDQPQRRVRLLLEVYLSRKVRARVRGQDLIAGDLQHVPALFHHELETLGRIDCSERGARGIFFL